MKIRYTTNKEELDYKELGNWKLGDAEAHDKKWYKKLLRNAPIVVVAFDGDKMVGFVRTFGDDLVWLMIASLHVHPDYRKKGIATGLLKRVEQFAQKNKYQTLRLFAAIDEDPQLKNFYFKNNFEEMDSAMRSTKMPW